MDPNEPVCKERRLIFTAEHGGNILSWDLSPIREEVILVHRCPNAMLAQIILIENVSLEGPVVPAGISSVVAMDGRVEYCKPQVAFLFDGGLLARMNMIDAAVIKEGVDLAAATPYPVKHGLWTWSGVSREVRVGASI